MRCEQWDIVNKCFWCGKNITRKEGELPPICKYTNLRYSTNKIKSKVEKKQ